VNALRLSLRIEAVDVGNLTDVIRVASQRPLKDAAFFIASNIKNRRIEENAFNVLKSSHMGASDSEIDEAIAASNKLEVYCLAMPHDCLDDRDKAHSVLQKAKDDNPGFISETYSLIEGYVRTSKGTIALAEEYNQEEDSITSRDWSDIPYFKKPLFLIVTFLIFTPVYIIFIWSGDTYYRRRGIVYRTSLKRKRLMTVVALLPVAFYFLRSIG
jgi:hypothetical protein